MKLTDKYKKNVKNIKHVNKYKKCEKSEKTCFSIIMVGGVPPPHTPPD
jgi:hypothetical protein